MADHRQIVFTSYTLVTSSVSIKIKSKLLCYVLSEKKHRLVSCKSWWVLSTWTLYHQNINRSATVQDVYTIHWLMWVMIPLLYYIQYCIGINDIHKSYSGFNKIHCILLRDQRVFIFEASVGPRDDRCKLFVYLSTSHGFTTPLLSGF